MANERAIEELKRRMAGGGPVAGGMTPRQAARRERAIGELRSRMASRPTTVRVGGTTGTTMSSDELKARMNEIVKSMPQEKVKNDPSWTKGLGLVGKALDVIDTPGSYLRSKVSTIATGIEEGDLSKVLGGLPVVGEVANTLDNFGGDPNAPKGLLSKVIFADKQQEKDFWANTGTGEYLQRGIEKRGWQGTPIDNAWAKRLIGLTGDIGLDPLTWASGGTKAVVGTTAKGAATVAGKELAEQAVEQTVKQGSRTLAKGVADDVARAAADDAIAQGGKTAINAAKAGDDLIEVAKSAKLKPRLVQGYKAISDLYFEQARSLPLDDAMRGQLEQIGANIRRARSTWVASRDELALVGAQRGIWLPGKKVVGSNSKTLDSALRAKEALGGGARRVVSDPAAKVFEGTFGNEKINELKRDLRSGVGEKAATAATSIAFEQFARHRANGMMVQLAKGFGQAIQVAEKDGVDVNDIYRAVQDDAVLQQVAARSPKAAEGVQGIRDQFRVARNMYEESTGVAMPDNPFYMPRRFTAEAQEFINGNPEFVSEKAGPAAFTQARTLRSGQDNATREVEKQSSVFLGAEVPRNLTDAQVTDWANARYRQMFGEGAPQLFETDARKLISSYLNEFKRQVHQDLFTYRMLDSGYGSEQAQRAFTALQDSGSAYQQFIGKVRGSKAELDRLFDRLDRMVSGLASVKEFDFRWVGADGQSLKGKVARDYMVREMRAAREELARGNWSFIENFALYQEDQALQQALRATKKVAKAWRDYASEMRKLRERAASELGQASQAMDRFDARAPFVAVTDTTDAEARAVRAGEEAGKNYVPTDADRAILQRVEDAVAPEVKAILRGEDLILPNETGRRVGSQAEIDAALQRIAGLSDKGQVSSFGPVGEEALARQSRLGAAKGELDRLQSELPSISAMNKYKSNPNAWGRMMGKVNETYRRVVKEQLGIDVAGFKGDIRKASPDDIRQAISDQILADQRRVASESAYNAVRESTLARQAAGRNEQGAALAWDLAAKQRRYDELVPRPVQKEIERFFAGNKEMAVMHDYAIRRWLTKDLMRQAIDADRIVPERIADLQETVSGIEQALTLQNQHMAGEFVDATTNELKRGVRWALDELNQFASGAKNDLADWLRLELGVTDLEGKVLLSYSFNPTTRRDAPRSVSRQLRGDSARKARKSSKSAEGGIKYLLKMDAEGQIEPMLRNTIARSALAEGFNTLPDNVQAIFARTQENILRKGNFKNALDLYDRLNNVLKGWLLAKPGFVFRNIVGGLFMNVVDGVSIESHVRMLRAWKADMLRQQGKPGAWERLNKRDKYVYERVREILNQGDTLAGSTSRGTGNPTAISRLNPGSSDFFYTAGIRSFNTIAEDVVLRGAMAFDTLSRDPALMRALRSGDQGAVNRALAEAQTRAVTRVNTFHFSYDKADKSVFENEVLTRMMPFYTYTKNAIPLMVSMMIERPKYFAWANAVARNLQLGVPEDGVLPEYIREAGAIRTPFTYGGNRVYWMQDLPFNQLVDSSQNPVNFVASSFTPLLKTPVELTQGQQFYKQIPITQDMKESKFANVPLLSQALTALGAQQRGENGQMFMRDDLQYALGQLVPPAYQLGNYTAATDTQQLKLPTRVVSDTTGIRLRVNTPEDQKNELARQKIKEREEKAKRTREKNRGFGG